MSNPVVALREQAAKLATDAQAYYKKNAENWTAENQTNFQQMVDDSASKSVQADNLEATAKQADELNKYHYEVSTTQPNVRLKYSGESNTSDENKKKFHKEAFKAYILGGIDGIRDTAIKHNITTQEAFAHVVKDQELGGFTAPDEFRAEVIKDLAGFSVVRNLARTVTTSSNAVVWPSIQPASTDADVRSSGFAGDYKSEAYVTGGTAPTVQNQPKFGQERIQVHTWAPNAIELSLELMQDTSIDLDGILAEIVAETLALDGEDAFINGNGIGRPLGLLSSGLTEVASGAANLISYGGLVDLMSGLPAQYRQNGTYLMSSGTYGAILKLAGSSNDHPIFAPNMQVANLWGRPIAFSEFMPEVADNAKAILFGDFRYYVIVDRQQLMIKQLNERFVPNLGILPIARFGGKCVRPAAFRVMDID